MGRLSLADAKQQLALTPEFHQRTQSSPCSGCGPQTVPPIGLRNEVACHVVPQIDYHPTKKEEDIMLNNVTYVIGTVIKITYRVHGLGTFLSFPVLSVSINGACTWVPPKPSGCQPIFPGLVGFFLGILAYCCIVSYQTGGNKCKYCASHQW